MAIEAICTKSVDTATAEETIARAAERMLQRSVGALVVIDGGHLPIGILTDRDLVTRAMCKRKDADMATVADVMTREPKTMAVDGSIEDALDLMQRGAFRRLPIIDARGRLFGIVTLDDIIRYHARQLLGVGFLLARETPAAAAIPKNREH